MNLASGDFCGSFILAKFTKMRRGCFCSTFSITFAITVFVCIDYTCLADRQRTTRYPKESESDKLPITDSGNFVSDHDQDEFIRQLFVKYGDGQGQLSFKGFKALMGNIGLGGDRDRMHDHREQSDRQSGQGASQQHRQVENGGSVQETDSRGDGLPASFQEPVLTQDWESQQDQPLSEAAATTTADEHLEDQDRAITPTTHNEIDHYHLTQCLSPDSLLDIFEIPTSATGLNKNQFVQLCPVLLQQLDSHACMLFDVEGDHYSHDDHAHHDSETSTEDDHDHTTQDNHGMVNATGNDRNGSRSGHIWGYGIAAVTLISMASIACILVVPCMQHYPHLYQRLLTFLVAMAVGTLAGDAMMHLIPHSFGIHVHDDDRQPLDLDGDGHAHEALKDEKEHARNAVWKGFFVLIGIFIFFIIEQVMGYFQEVRKKRKARQKKIRKHSDPKSSSQRPLHRANSASHRENSDEQNQGDYNLMVPSSDVIGEKLCYHCVAATKLAAAPGHNREIIRNSMLLIEDFEINNQVNQSPTSNHHHQDDTEASSSHHHGHSHDPPSASSIATLVWIVVMGDGLHNFCDGLIVGAAFADSVAGGLSTSIAVMCHEVPHELGDFAVMLKGGMSIKQAMCVQAVSSVLAYLGLSIGIAAGDVAAVSMWIFALAGGMFIYIALVDLFPELIETLNGKPGKKLQFLILQSAGTLLGVLLMLLIGLQEDWLREQLDS